MRNVSAIPCSKKKKRKEEILTSRLYKSFWAGCTLLLVTAACRSPPHWGLQLRCVSELLVKCRCRHDAQRDPWIWTDLVKLLVWRNVCGLLPSPMQRRCAPSKWIFLNVPVWECHPAVDSFSVLCPWLLLTLWLLHCLLFNGVIEGDYQTISMSLLALNTARQTNSGGSR